MMARQTDALHLRLITLFNRWAKTSWGREMIGRAQLPDAQPADREIYLGALGVAWGRLILIGLGVFLVIGSLLDAVYGKRGNTIALSIAAFILVFCAGGVVDATWRAQFVGAARRRQARKGNTVDERVQRLMHLSRINDCTLLLQLIAGVVAAWLIG